MLRTFRGDSPSTADSAFISEMAYLVGDVTIDAESSVWPFVCIRGDHKQVPVGTKSNVQEFSMVHGADIGDRVTIGHNVTLDFATVGNNSLIGMSSTILKDAEIGSNCIVAAGTVVREEETIPDGHIAYGNPLETKPIEDKHRDRIKIPMEHYVDLGKEVKFEGGLE
jgi:carbonic anhydrase/acetyltransferase-like protein (isoleucine patch superfamily)